MEYWVYILYSETLNGFYKGQTHHVQQRLQRYNSGTEKATQNGRPWLLIWSTKKSSRAEAIALESKLKHLSQKRTIRFIKKYEDGVAGPDALRLLAQWSGY